MRGICIAGAAVLAVAGEIHVRQPQVTLLTVVQRDRMRTQSHPASASISADGRYIAFVSYERLTAADDDDLADVHVLDTVTGAVTLESATVDGSPINADCGYPRISGDGRYLVFETAVSSTRASLAFADVVFRDRVDDVARRLSRAESGAAADGWSGGAVISDDGTAVVFESSAPNLVTGGDANGGRPDIYLVQTATGRIRRLSVDQHGLQPSVGASVAPSMSADGRYVAFASSSALVPATRGTVADRGGGTGDIYYIHVRDTLLNVTTRINANAEGAPPNGASHRAVISRDGAYVAFSSTATNLVSGDRNRSSDVFLYEVRTGSITLVSRSVSGRPANGTSRNPSISADGRFVAFQSDASDLVCARNCPPSGEDINLVSDVFLFDRVTGLTTWVSTGGAGGWMEESVAPVLDAAGRVLAFMSRHPTDEGDIEHDFDLFVRLPAAGGR